MVVHRPAWVFALAFLAGVACARVAAAAPGAFSEETVERFTATYGASARERLLAWEDLMVEHRADLAADKRERANDFWNRVPWLMDDEHWGRRDYWATPFEMLGTWGGDCEDYSIAKYFTLTEMDVPRGRLLITYVRARALDIPHMVLAWYPTPDADPWILDNLQGTVRRGSERPDLIPVYSFNADGLWAAKQRGRGRAAGPASRIDMWNDLLRRMKGEGTLAGRKGF